MKLCDEHADDLQHIGDETCPVCEADGGGIIRTMHKCNRCGHWRTGMECLYCSGQRDAIEQVLFRLEQNNESYRAGWVSSVWEAIERERKQ